MLKRSFLFICILFQLAWCQAQDITGIVKDAKTNQSLAFVNVGVIGKGIGTVTDDNGRFAITLHNNGADSLRISMIGYIPKSFLLSDYQSGKIIALVPNNIHLQEVNIASNQLKEKILGNKTQSKTTSAGFNDNALGHEIGEIIHIKKSPTFVKRFYASLANPATDSVKLRLNIYSVKKGLPDKIIQQQNIYVTVYKGQQNITVNLEPYHIIVNDNFFVGLEWIENSYGSGIMFSASLLSSPMISRETSQADWEKIGIAGIGFTVLAAY